MSVKPLLAAPGFPQLETAGDPRAMLEVFRSHLEPVGEKSYHVRDCRLARIRYRQDTRCILQYALRLVESETGRERSQLVTGVIYAEEGRAGRISRKLRAAYPAREIPDPLLTFEPVSFIPDLGMLVQVFPYDRRLSALPLLAGPSPELEPLLLSRFGPGDWRAETWDVELVRYREQLGAVLRHALRVRDAATGRRDERRFYVKARRDDEGERAYLTLQELKERAEHRRAGFTVVDPIFYLSGYHAYIFEEAPGVSLQQILLQGHDAPEAARKIACALAAFNQDDVYVSRRHTLRDQITALGRAGRLLGWACPHLKVEIQRIIAAVSEGLKEVPPRPTHRDLKTDHIFLDGVRVVFIDFDSFAGADPVLDPALLLAHLAALPGLRPVPRQRARAAARVFADEYFAHVPKDWRGRLPLHYAGALLEVAHGFFRRQEPDWSNKISALVEEAEDSLSGGVW